MESVEEAHPAIVQVLSEPKNQQYMEYLLTNKELATLRSLISVLRAVHFVTEIMSATKYPVCSLVIPSVEKLKTYFAQQLAIATEPCIKCNYNLSVFVKINQIFNTYYLILFKHLYKSCLSL
jgi:hypothetical protein